MVMFDWWAGLERAKVVWSFVTIKPGELSVMMAGTQLMSEWFVASWAMSEVSTPEVHASY